METFKYIIFGGGVAAGYAAQQFVESGIRKGELAILSAEASLPYDRPPLSKGFLRGAKKKDDILVNPPSFYKEHGIRVFLKTRAAKLDTRHSRVATESGDEYGYEKLLLAAGARLRRFDLPGAKDAGIRYLRRVEDSEAIQKAAKSAKRPVVIGGGFIGLEVAASLTQLGKAPHVVFPEPRPLRNLWTAEMADFFTKYFENEGVVFHPETSVAGFEKDGSTIHVRLESGDTLESDLVVAGIGVEPEMSLCANTGIKTNDGVEVDASLQTSVENIYAVGDLASYHDQRYPGRLRVEHWQNAVDQGKTAAKNMAGAREPFRNAPYFFSDMFKLSWEFWGNAAHSDEAVHVGDFEHGSFSVWWLLDGKVQASFILNRIAEERSRAMDCVEKQTEVPEDILERGRAVELEHQEARLSGAALG